MSTIRASTTSTTALVYTADTTGKLDFQTGSTPTTYMTLDSSGNLGIGTTSPSVRLHAYAASNETMRLESSSTSFDASLRIFQNGTAITNLQGGVGVTGGGTFLATITSAPLVFGTGNAERARIDSSGNFYIGGTSFNGKLAVQSSTAAFNNPTLMLSNSWSGDVGYAGLYLIKADNNTSTSQVLVRFAINGNAAGQGQINANGANACAFGSFSDARLKENIVDLPSQLDKIMALRPVEFDYIESEGGGHQTGFIAQEMQEVYPDAVGVREPDQMLTVTGWNKTEAILVKAIQEQQAIIKTLTNRITALESK